MLDDIQIEDRTANLVSGQSLVVYTDGIPEARSPDGLFFSDGKLSEILAACTGRTVMETCKHVVSSVTAFQAENLADDITILIMKRN